MAVTSAIRLGLIYGTDVRIDWRPEIEEKIMAANYEDLFLNRHRLYHSNYSIKDFPYHILLAGSNPVDISRVWQDIFIERHHFFAEKPLGEIDKLVFCNQIKNVFWDMQPNSRIMEKLKPFEGIDFSNGIGLHVRRPLPGREERPSEDIYYSADDTFYIRLAESLRASGSTGPIYLASISEQSRKVIAHWFDDVHFMKVGSYDAGNSISAIEDAMAEIIMLSRAGVITRHWFSTFGLFSAVLGAQRQCIIDKDNNVVLNNYPGY